MNIKALHTAVKTGQIEWQRHSFERMMERGISREAVKSVLVNGEIIEDYPSNRPYPSALFLGWNQSKPLHVVAALDESNERCFIITAYQPDLEHFKSGFKIRRQR